MHALMRAIVADPAIRTPDSLTIVEIARPEPGPGQILVRVRAAGVNRPDVFQRMGLYPPPPGAPDTLGLEIAGEVEAVGPGVERWRTGDRVAALLGGGGYAEYAVVDGRHALPIPEQVDFRQAAVLPETVFTVWANVFEIGTLKQGQTLAVHGATSGIGVTAVQMAKAAGATVVATSRGADKARQALALGADVALDSTETDFEARLAEARPDVILDMVGEAFFDANLAALADGGRLVVIAFQSGTQATLDLSVLMRRRLTIAGSTLRGRSAEEKARLALAIEQAVWPWIADGRLAPPIEAVLPLSQAADAHRLLEAGSHLGKIVLEP